MRRLDLRDQGLGAGSGGSRLSRSETPSQAVRVAPARMPVSAVPCTDRLRATMSSARLGRSGWQDAHVIASATHDVTESLDVPGRERVEEKVTHHLDVPGQNLGKQGSARCGDIDDDGSLIVGTCCAGDEPRFLQ